MTRDELLLAITHCPEIDKARADAGHPCADIVGLQQPDQFQKPEPWRGHIDTAPILFVSSNPSIRGKDPFPPDGWEEQDIINHYQRCFDDDATIPGHIDKATYNRVPFWTGVRNRASEILGRPAIPGTDFALTELVHCKSEGEKGVAKAHLTCAGQWLDLVLQVSGANIIVLLGSQARDHCAARWGLDKAQKVHFDVATPGRKRAVVILPHPNARGRRKLDDFVGDDELDRLRALLPPGY